MENRQNSSQQSGTFEIAFFKTVVILTTMAIILEFMAIFCKIISPTAIVITGMITFIIGLYPAIKLGDPKIHNGSEWPRNAFLQLALLSILGIVLTNSSKCNIEEGGYVILGLYGLIIASVLSSIIFVLARKCNNRVLHPALIILVSILSANCFIISVNIIADSKEPMEYSTVIVGKDSYSGKGSSSWFYLAPCGPFTKQQKAFVSGWDYRKYGKGDKVFIQLHSGFLEVKWYTLSFDSESRGNRQ
ncbi:MAG: hypothetical protein H6Q73_2372 [Firmicutes bacterium]|nr:hypothetical protein [Bacillota bacterium]